MSLLSREAWTLASWSSDLMPAEARSLTCRSSTGSASVHARRRRSQVTVGWASPIDIHTCSRIVAEQIAWKSRIFRREECTSVFLRILRKRQRAVTSTCHSPFSSQSQEESFSSRLLQTACMSGWVTLSVARSPFLLFRASRGFLGFAQAGGRRARELRACAGVILVRARGSQPPPPYCKKCRHLCQKM